ncbi:MAG: hypothetical protein ACREXK_13045 [Gammaproteobacteria bacterium]
MRSGQNERERIPLDDPLDVLVARGDLLFDSRVRGESLTPLGLACSPPAS